MGFADKLIYDYDYDYAYGSFGLYGLKCWGSAEVGRLEVNMSAVHFVQHRKHLTRVACLDVVHPS